MWRENEDEVLDDLDEMLTEEALDRVLCRIRVGRGYGNVLNRLRDTDIVLRTHNNACRHYKYKFLVLHIAK
jgi:hypothetical protein